MSWSAATEAFTALNLSLCNKELRVEITISHWENESKGFVDCEPLSFSLKVPAFHRPCKLDFHIKSTTKDFRNIFSKGLLESILLLKITQEDWKKLIYDYECYLERRYGLHTVSSDHNHALRLLRAV